MIDVLLVLNTGSSSLKFEVFAYRTLDRLIKGKVTGIGTGARLTAVVEESGARIDRALESAGHDTALGAVIALIDRHDDGWRMVASVHRIVHGGADFVAPVIVTPGIRAALERLVPLAPLHQPYNLAGISAAGRLAEAPSIACFDTAFHAGHAPIFQVFAVERALRDRGIRRYGFHGLSYDWIARVLKRDHPGLAKGRLVVGHLGNGASLCALRDGRSIDTTMGMTALDGVPMGSRPGAIDAGAVTFMIRELGMDVRSVEETLYERSGLKGLSGISNDVRTLLESADPRAAFALDHYALKIAQQAAMMAVSMGGMDGFVFTGGVGENAAPVRGAILDRLAFLRPFEVLVIPANEERMMAIHAKALLKDRG
ncbi:acetate/propionate family kinase [Ensifer soli]|uniref:acetate/propionate family kinase n=1 Tax=Ciceribacter sp. sgz301302 TaxID=3342379 RepID=UPI0035BAE141